MKPDLFECKIVVVCATVRNPSKKTDARLSALVGAIQRAQCVITVSAVVIESDSREKEFEFSQTSQITNLLHVKLGNLREQFPEKVSRLAFCRDQYLKELRNISPDIVVIADLDSGSFQRINFDLALDGLSEYSAIFCSWQPFYYDTFALRARNWMSSDYRVDDSKNRNPSLFYAPVRAYTAMRRLSTRVRYIPVDSAFGGLAIYDYQPISKLSYAGGESGDFAVCEHVTLNGSLVANGHKIAIDSKLKVWGMNRHVWIRLMLVPVLGPVKKFVWL